MSNTKQAMKTVTQVLELTWNILSKWPAASAIVGFTVILVCTLGLGQSTKTIASAAIPELVGAAGSVTVLAVDAAPIALGAYLIADEQKARFELAHRIGRPERYTMQEVVDAEKMSEVTRERLQLYSRSSF